MMHDKVVIVDFAGKRFHLRVGQVAQYRGQDSVAVIRRSDTGFISITVREVGKASRTGEWNREHQEWDWDDAKALDNKAQNTGH